MKKITLLLSVAIATLFMATGCQKTCYDQNGYETQCPPPGSDCGCNDQNGDGYPDDDTNNNNNGGYGTSYYYITEASSFESIDVDVSEDGQCDGDGTETWTIVTVFEDPIENIGQYSVVVPYHITESQFNFSNDSFYQTTIRSLDQYYNCNWSGSFDLPYDELLSWWK
jgi:hypothetical protein